MHNHEPNSIEWHKECLTNSKSYQERLIEELKNNLISKIEYTKEIQYDNDFRSFQIESAVNEKKEKFNDEVYKKKMKKKMRKTYNILENEKKINDFIESIFSDKE